jgi:hypothetical protein
MVATDLHGDWDAYRRYRDRFVNLQAEGLADCLILTGDLIHPDEPSTPDSSLEIVLDVLALQEIYGEAIICICGNHELPHIYGFGLGKGATEYSPAFEAALSRSSCRPVVMEFFRTLPFYVRTAAGVSLTHAGASGITADVQNMRKLFEWSHCERITEADALLADTDVAALRRAYARLSQAESYDALARHYLAIAGPDDPRYNDLLRGFFAITNPDFGLVRSALFTKCEQEYGMAEYGTMLAAMLRHLSLDYVPQQMLVAGHMTIPNGYQVIAGRHLRLASACHATPREAGLYLLFDTACPVEKAADLLAGLYSVY